MQEHNTTELTCYLEIAATANRGRNDSNRFRYALAELATARICDCSVSHVIQTDQGSTPGHVPDFGHDSRCQCDNESDQAAYGVLRYFGITLIVSGSPQLDVFGVYKINDYARLIVCGKGPKPEPSAYDLEIIGRVHWNEGLK